MGLARQLGEGGVQSSLEFWSLLGRVFVHDGHFLRDPYLIIDMLKPLVHHNIVDPRFGFKKKFLTNPTDFSCDEWLEQLHLAVTPGIDFDQVGGSSWMRFSVSGSTETVDISDGVAITATDSD